MLMANLKTGEEVLQELIQQDESDDEDIRWTENWALLLVCILVSDRKCKYSIGHYKFRVFNFRDTFFRGLLFRKIS